MSKEKQKDANGFVWIILIGMVAVGLWAGSGVFIRGLYPKLAESALFGDMFGAINSLFSGLALGGVVVAIFLQRRDLELTRKDMRDQQIEQSRQRRVMVKQQKLMEKQTATMELQQFEATFNNLLAMHKELVREIYEYSDDDDGESELQKTGFAYFDTFHYECEQVGFEKAHTEYGDDIVQYLYRVQNILTYVDSYGCGRQRQFVQLFRACFTAKELAVMKLYQTEHYGFESLWSLTAKYDFYSSPEWQ